MWPRQLISLVNNHRQVVRILSAATLLVLISGCKPPGGELARLPGELSGIGLPMAIVAAGDTLVAVGEHGRIGISRDQGATWRYQQSIASELLTAASFSSDEVGYAVGHALTIMKTTDGAETWQLYKHQEAAVDPLFDVVAVDDQVAVAVGAYGNIHRTADGGQSWQKVNLDEQQDGYLTELMGAGEVPVSESHYYGVACVPSAGRCHRMIAVGEGGAMLLSTDLGASWRVLENDADITFFGIVNDGHDLLAYGMFGQAMRSADGGGSWHKVDTGTQQTLLSAAWLDDGPGLLVGYDGINRYVGRASDQARRSAGYSRRDLLTAVHDLGDGTVILGGAMGLVRAELEDKHNDAPNDLAALNSR